VPSPPKAIARARVDPAPAAPSSSASMLENKVVPAVTEPVQPKEAGPKENAGFLAASEKRQKQAELEA